MATGITAFLDILSAAGVTHIFGNPGTTELPLNDALAADKRFRYIFGLQEIPVTAMADGYAMASGRLGVVCVHIACGLGNAMGMLYNAHVAGTPLLMFAGQQDRRLVFGEPVLSGDLLGMARSCVKWSAEVQRVQDVPNAVRRAIQAALTPPTGPVFLALPLDVQFEEVDDLDLRPPTIPGPLGPLEPVLKQAAELLAGSHLPVILAGSRVTECRACENLLLLADRLGAPVYSECGTSHGRCPMSPASHLYAGPLPLWGAQVRKLLEPHDVILVAGMNLLREYIWQDDHSPVPRGSKLIHADVKLMEIGKNFPVDVAIPGDLGLSLGGLDHLLERSGYSPEANVVAERSGRQRERRQQEQADLRAKTEERRSRRPMSSLVLMDAIDRSLPKDVAVVEEATTTGNHYLERIGSLQDPYGLIAHRGWALGWGIGCTLGVQLAWPDRPALGLIGDGAAMYGIQGLWSAAHHRIPATFVIANNAQYKILKVCGDMLPLPEMARHNYLGMDLTGPEVDFVALARALGVEAHRVTEPDELTDRLRASWQRAEPILFDVPIER